MWNFSLLVHHVLRCSFPKINNPIERFNKTVLDEFFRIAFRENFFESAEALQKTLDRMIRGVKPLLALWLL